MNPTTSTTSATRPMILPVGRWRTALDARRANREARRLDISSDGCSSMSMNRAMVQLLPFGRGPVGGPGDYSIGLEELSGQSLDQRDRLIDGGPHGRGQAVLD